MNNSLHDRPLVTFALFAYNQEAYIRDAVRGAFSQTYSPLEIVLSDDCSTDRTYEIMHEMAVAYAGPHDVKTRQSKINRGLGCHVNDVLALANGEYIAMAAGDDISEADRVKDVISILSNMASNGADPIQYSALSKLRTMDDNGRLGSMTKIPNQGEHIIREPFSVYKFGLDDLIGGRLFTSGPSRVFSRALYEVFGNIRDDCFTEDITYLFRSVLAGHVLFIDKPTVQYRIHSKSLSQPSRLYAKSFTGVEAQLRLDLETARRVSLITPDAADRAEKWIDGNVALRNFYRVRLNGERPSISDLFTLLTARHLSPRRKFGIFREFLGIR